MTDLLFVYGTLRKDLRGSMFHLLPREARFVAHARVQGCLYDLGEYPGFVPSAEHNASVHGEVYAIDFPQETLARLDEYEGCSPNDPEPYEFERVKGRVTLESGGIETAWFYVYKGPTNGRRRIETGDFFREAR